MRVLLLSILTLLATQMNAQSPEFKKMVESNTSGTVPFIYPEEMQQGDFLILDTRTKAEYEVSHIPGAIWVGYEEFNLDKNMMVNKHQDVIVYCSVGYRSEKIGEQLLSAGFSSVSNLYGGIFHWKNTGHEVVNNEGPTENVHTYNQEWGKWLFKGVKVSGK